jgi:PAS domain S-box-containing protein
MKLSLKIGLITAAVAGAVAVSISLNHTFWEGQAWRTELRSHTATMADMLALNVEESLLNNDFAALEKNVKKFVRRPEIAYAVVYDNSAVPLAATGSKSVRQAIENYQENPRQQEGDIHKHVFDGQEIHELFIPIKVEGRDWGMLQVGFYENKILAIYHRTNQFNYLILLLGLGVCLTAGWLVARYLGKPIEALTEGADQLVKSNYDHRINIKRKDELGRLVSAFNTMAGTIRQDMVELGSKNRQLLKAQERQVWLARIAEQVGEGVAVCDLEGILTFVNHSWAEMHGYTPEQMLGKHISISHSNSQMEREVLPFNQKVMEKGLNAGTVGHIKKDRTVFYTEMTTTLLKNSEGEALGFIGVARDITEQKKVQDDLKRERDVIKSIFAATPDAVIITDLSGNFTEANNKAIELLELGSREELTGKNFSLFIAPDDRGLALHNFQKTLDYGSVSNVQVNVLTAKNGQFPLEYSTSLLHNLEGRPTNIVAVGRSIALRKKAEKDLAESEKNYRILAETSPDMIFLIRPDSIVSYVNRHAAKSFGLSPSEIIGRSINDLFRGDQGQRQWNNIRKVIDSGKELFVEAQSQFQGQNIWLETWLVPVKDETGAVVNVLGISRDITQRKKIELTLAESEGKYRGLVETTDTGFVIIDGQGKVIDANDAYVRLTGRASQAEIMGRPVTEWTAPQDMERNRLAVEACAKKGSVRGLEINYAHPDGTLVPIEINATVVKTESGVRIVTLCRDITIRKQTENAISDLNKRFEYALGATKTGFDIIDAEYNVHYIDPEWKKSYGEPAGRKCYEYFMGRKDVCPTCGISKALRDKQTIVTEEYLEREKRWVEVHSIPFQNPSGQWLVAEFNIDINERKLNEQRLKASEQKYRELADTLPQTVFEMDGQGLLIYANKTGFAQFGYDQGDFDQGIRVLNMLAPQDRDRAGQNITRRLKGNPAENQEYLALRKDGSTFPISIYVSPVLEEGKIRGLRGVIVDISEQKKAEQILRESETRFRSLAEASPAGILAYREKFIYANPACQVLTGYSPEEMLGLNFWELIHPDHREMVKQRGLARQRGEKVPANYEFKIIRKNGQVRWVDFSGSTASYDGQPAGLGMALDITERKTMEEILRSSEAQYRTTIDSIGDAIYVVDRDLKIILANALFAEWCRQLELGKEPAGRNLFDVCPFLEDGAREEYLRVFETGQPLVTRGQNAVSGKTVLTETRKIPIAENGRVTRVITVIRDITQETEAAQKLAESEMKYQQVLEGVAEGIYRTTPEGRILLANQSIVKMLGYGSLEELMARDIQKEGYPDQKDRREFVGEMSRRGQVKNWVSEWRKKDGSVMVARENAHVVKDRSGKVIYYEGTVEDITEQRQAEQKLAESERKYSQIFEDIVEGVYRTTPEGKVLLANPALVKMLGFDNLQQLISLDLNKSGYMEPSTRQRFKELMERDGQVLGFEARWKRPDGKILMISENARVVKGGQNEVLYYEGTIEDITERQKAQEELLNEKNKLSDLFRISLQVARAGDIQKKLDLTMEGIAGTEMFSRAVLVLKNEEGGNSHIAHFGMTAKEVSSILKASPAKAEHLEKIFDKKYRYSNSYYIPHDARGIDFSVKLVNKKYQPSGDWQSDDVLLVPLTIKDRHIGYLTVDEPADGKVPSLETVRLLELFCYQAAVAIDNLRLYSDLERSYYGTLKAFVAAMDAKDPYTKGHSENVRYHALNIARRLKLPEEQVKLIDFSSLLHDIGKLAIRDEILTKPSLLSDHEYQEVKLHPVIGSHLVSEVESLLKVAPIIHSHHEHYDGSGYPQGIKGDQIPLEARIIAVADAFEAMTSDRPYRKAFDLKVAVKRLQDAAGTQFDKEIVRVFIKLHQETHG